MRRRVPLTIAFIIGVFMAIQFFIPHRIIQSTSMAINRWSVIIVAGSLILGVLSLIKHHSTRIRRRSEGWGYSMVTILAIAVTAIAGFLGEFRNVLEAILPEGIFGWMEQAGLFGKMQKGSLFMRIYESMLYPLESTVFSLLAFYIASAAFRAFRARNLEAALLLIAAFVVMLGRVPVGYWLHEWIPDLAHFILDFPNTGAKRAIMIGVGLGMASTALKIITGVEKTYLGTD
jgi:hypothetical protein